MINNKKIHFNFKRTTISLSDNISPLYRFLNARKNLKDIYMSDKKCKTLSNVDNINNNLLISNNKKEKNIKKYQIKANSVKLLKDQIFILSHFCKRNISSEINYDYGSSLLNTFGNRNFFKKNNEKMNANIFTKFTYNNNNFFKTAAPHYTLRRNTPKQKVKTSQDKIILPKVNYILKKNTKS